ncbi:MAG: hypothetical protein ACPGD8_04180, partial [Flavobacteriales bacterium]
MRYRILGLFLLLLFSSCDKYLNRSLMLRTGPNYPYSEFTKLQETSYKLAPNDIVVARVFTNDGAGLINVGTGAQVLVGSGA